MRISRAAFDLIVAEEVTSQAVYTQKYRRPEWPGASSGATIGIGYDLGQTPRATIEADWKGRVSAPMLAAMLSAQGAKGDAGRAAAARIRDQVDIPWEVASAVHEQCVVPRWEAKVAAALPNTDKLSADCFGALVSLTFNRGASFSTPQKQGDTSDRYREMRAIKAFMASGEFAKIPAQFRAMKRLWPTLPGLINRREHEAVLFEKGLAAPAAVPPAPTVPPSPPPIAAQPVPPPPAEEPASAGAALIQLIAAVLNAIFGRK